MKIKIDRFTQDQAVDYANREAAIHGFDRSSEKWKNAYKKSVSESLETMTLGRNPFSRNPREEATWPEIFGNDGFCARVAFNYKGRDGEKVTRREIAERVKASIASLVYMYLNGVMNIKTTTKTSDSGKIPNSSMSDLQLQGSAEDTTLEEAEIANMDVVMNQIILTVVETACFEFLLPFFVMKPDEIKSITSKIKVEGKPNVRGVAKLRTDIEKRIRARIGDKLKKMSFADLVLQD